MAHGSPSVAAALLLSLCAAGARVSTAGETRLADATMRRDAAAVRVLGQKVDVNAPGKDGTPPLHWVVRGDDFDGGALLGAGADPTRPTATA